MYGKRRVYLGIQVRRHLPKRIHSFQEEYTISKGEERDVIKCSAVAIGGGKGSRDKENENSKFCVVRYNLLTGTFKKKINH